MKKSFYVLLFTLLGCILQLLLHAVVENWYIQLLVTDFNRFSLGLSWSTWFTIHQVGTAVLLVLGLAAGFLQGKYWWYRLYEKTN